MLSGPFGFSDDNALMSLKANKHGGHGEVCLRYSMLVRWSFFEKMNKLSTLTGGRINCASAKY